MIYSNFLNSATNQICKLNQVLSKENPLPDKFIVVDKYILGYCIGSISAIWKYISII